MATTDIYGYSAQEKLNKMDINLTQEELARYSRHLNLPEVGQDGQKK